MALIAVSLLTAVVFLLVGLVPVVGAFSINSYMRLLVIRQRLLACGGDTVHVFAARRPWSISERLRGLVLAAFGW